MNAPDAAVLAYRATRDTVVREYPLRLVATAGVAWIVSETGHLAAAALWWTAIAALLGAEALIYRRAFRQERASVPMGLAALFAFISTLCAVVYTGPVFVMLDEGSPAFVFAASAFMAGTLIHLTVHNANTRLIYASAATPMALAFLAAGIALAGESGNLIPVLTVLLFIAGMLAAYLGRSKAVRQINAAMAEALKEREAARAASAAKTVFLAKMSHELRTPLNGMIGMAEALRAGAAPGARTEEIDTIIKSGDALSAMLNEILDHATIEAGGVEFDPHEDDLGDVVEEAVAAFRPAAAEKGIALGYDGSGLEEPRLRFDRRRLRQALAHIIGNAVKFTDSGAILVRARAARGPEEGRADVEIGVSDTGVGMTAEECARVLEAFEQADNSMTRRFGGAGLGLSLARGLAVAAGGDLSVRSSPGAGTTVTLRFSSCLPGARAAAPVPQPAAFPDGARVLLVEDNLVNRQVVRALLRPLNVDVIEAENGAEALARLTEARFDLVLMDLHMPVMDGLAATRAIRRSQAAWARVPVVALTAAASAEDRAASLEAGMNGFLPKPVKGAMLADAIARFARAERPAAATA